MRRAVVTLRCIALVFVMACSGCGTFGSGVIHTIAADYSFEGKKIALCVLVAPTEQQSLDDYRIIERSLADAPTSGYADDNIARPIGTDIGRIIAPERVKNLNQKIEHARHYREVISVIEDSTATILRQKGFNVVVVPVSQGEVRLQSLADSARSRGCDILAVETVSLVISWNIKRSDPTYSGDDFAGTFSWETFTGGMTLLNMALVDIPTGSIVWQHTRQAVSHTRVTTLIGELFNDRIAQDRYGENPAEYQSWLYRTSLQPSLLMTFASAEEGFIPLPSGTAEQPPSDNLQPGQNVFVRPTPEARIWHSGQVVSVENDRITIRWADGIWPEYAERTAFSPRDVMSADSEWPVVVWVRMRDKLEYTPYRFHRSSSSSNLLYVYHLGDLRTRTFATGRVGIIPY